MRTEKTKRLYVADLYIGDIVKVGDNEVRVTYVTKSKITVQYADGSMMTVNPKTHVVREV